MMIDNDFKPRAYIVRYSKPMSPSVRRYVHHVDVCSNEAVSRGKAKAMHMDIDMANTLAHNIGNRPGWTAVVVHVGMLPGNAYRLDDVR